MYILYSVSLAGWIASYLPAMRAGRFVPTYLRIDLERWIAHQSVGAKPLLMDLSPRTPSESSSRLYNYKIDSYLVPDSPQTATPSQLANQPIFPWHQQASPLTVPLRLRWRGRIGKTSTGWTAIGAGHRCSKPGKDWPGSISSLLIFFWWWKWTNS